MEKDIYIYETLDAPREIADIIYQSSEINADEPVVLRGEKSESIPLRKWTQALAIAPALTVLGQTENKYANFSHPIAILFPKRNEKYGFYDTVDIAIDDIIDAFDEKGHFVRGTSVSEEYKCFVVSGKRLNCIKNLLKKSYHISCKTYLEYPPQD